MESHVTDHVQKRGRGSAAEPYLQVLLTMEMRCEIKYTRRASEMIGKSSQLIHKFFRPVRLQKL